MYLHRLWQLGLETEYYSEGVRPHLAVFYQSISTRPAFIHHTKVQEKVGERRASSHELREKNREVRSGSLGDNRDPVRKVNSEINVRGQAPGQSQSPGERGGTIKGHLLPGRRLATAGPRTNYEEPKQSLKETIKQSMTTGYCYRATFLKNKS